MLKVNEIVCEYSGMEALQRVSMVVEKDEFVSIIGSNGAGKSSLLKAVSGTVPCRDGKIYFEDRDITKMKAHKRTGLGIIHVPEGRRIFPTLSVRENLELGAYRSQARSSIEKNIETVNALFPVLKVRHHQTAGTLSGGEQQMLAVGRGIMAMPLLMMLDEPSLGLAPVLADTIFETIKDIRQRLKISILLVEQRALEALELCDRGYILDCGRISPSSSRDELMGSSMV
ncbi:MAG: ABC transporter ATP-binding protein, partial [Pseudomonadota bacterium]